MTEKVPKSQADKISPDFAAAVEIYRQELMAHRFSQPTQPYRPARSASPEIPGSPAIAARHGSPAIPAIPWQMAQAATPEIPGHPGTPRPTHHPLVENCIIKVQSPGKPDEFVSDYEIVDDSPPPPSLTQLKHALLLEIAKQENELAQAIWPIGKRRLDELNEADILLKEEKIRTDEEKQFLVDLTDKKNKLSSLNRKAATLHSEIEDLTVENIKTWIGKLTD